MRAWALASAVGWPGFVVATLTASLDERLTANPPAIASRTAPDTKNSRPYRAVGRSRTVLLGAGSANQRLRFDLVPLSCCTGIGLLLASSYPLHLPVVAAPEWGSVSGGPGYRMASRT